MANDRDDDETETDEEEELESEGSDEDESDDEESDDEESEESDDDEPEESGDDEPEESDDDEPEESDDDDSEEVEASAKARPRKKARGKGKRRGGDDRTTAGARLAAARAAKAARKAAKRGKDLKEEAAAPIDQIKSSDLGQRAHKAGEWAQQNRNLVYGLVAALVVVLGGWIGWHYYSKAQAEDAAALLAEAVEITRGTLRGEDDPEPEEGEPPSFTSADARAEAALTAFQAVLDRYPGSDAAAWAHLGAGQALLELERFGEARSAFDAAIAASAGNSTIVWRALEGKGFSYEAEEEWAQAIDVYQELSRLDDNRYEPVAKYNTARMYLAQGQRQQATETLTALVTGLREAEGDEDAQEYAYVLQQAEIRLMELDPSAVPARPSLGGGPAGAGGPPGALGGGGPGGEMSPEQIQELIRRFQQKQAGGGAPTPATGE